MTLHRYGFAKAGEWKKSKKTKSHITFTLSKLANERVLYSFVVDGKPMYIGICENDKTTLEKRMNRYKSRAGNGHNEQICSKIKKALVNKSKVEIFAVNPRNNLKYRGVKVDLIKGLENPFIVKFKPLSWNL